MGSTECSDDAPAKHGWGKFARREASTDICKCSSNLPFSACTLLAPSLSLLFTVATGITKNSNKTERRSVPPEKDAQWQAHTNCLHPVSQTISRAAVCRMHCDEVSIRG